MILDHSRVGAPLLRASALVAILFAALVALRLPSLAQPAGADQALYAYVGQRILAGEQPYRDAWDQKPPGIHFLYAALWRLWPHESVVPAADLLAAAGTAALLLPLGRILGGPGGGAASALVFLLLSNPALTRLGGVRIRAQAETFIAVLATAAVLVAAERWRREGATAPPRRPLDLLGSAAGAPVAAGVLVGLAAVFKYPALAYALPVSVLLALAPCATRSPTAASEVRSTRHSPVRSFVSVFVRRSALVGIGALIPIAGMLAHFWYHGALTDLRLATLTYNLTYSGETYAGPLQALRFLVTFPIGEARLDPLWFVGGLGCLGLVVAGAWRTHLWVAPLWVGAAAIAIVVNGSRGLPQYFVQAGPALALAAGMAGALVWRDARPLARAVLIASVAIATWRIADVPRGLDYTSYDWQSLTGALDRATYLSRYGRADSGDKYSALAVHRLADYVASHSDPADRIFVFGFSAWAYVGSNRASASRWFWSRPVIVGFEAERPGYGWRGMLADLERARPKLVVLQRRDWDPYETNSDVYFLSNPTLEAWLKTNYLPSTDLYNFAIWIRR